MNLGISLPFIDDDALDGATYCAAMGMVEQTGFSGLWFFDAIGRPQSIADPLGAACAAAAVTSRIEIGTCILQVPLRNPVELAHRVLTAHLLSQGRLRLGVGAGSTAADFKAVGANFEGRFRHLREALPVMQKLWRGETVQGVDLKPWPRAMGGPPILIGSWAGSRWIPVAARQYDGWIASAVYTDIATLREGAARFKDLGGKRAIVTNIHVDLEAPSAALAETDKLDLRCGPEEAAARLRRLADIGFDDAILVVNKPDEASLSAIRALY
jgi:alkanesulfonate monooxygenase SsuD/methylene tetrahydromethanopterin reductase-like flavin-dependent oxidoreductase (luciferase family)